MHAEKKTYDQQFINSVHQTHNLLKIYINDHFSSTVLRKISNAYMKVLEIKTYFFVSMRVGNKSLQIFIKSQIYGLQKASRLSLWWYNTPDNLLTLEKC